MFKNFKSLTELNKFEKLNKVKIINIDFNVENKMWAVTFVNV